MIQAVENKQITIAELLKFFKSETKRQKDSTRLSYSKALLSFECYILGNSSKADPFDEAVIANWYVAARIGGATCKTAGFYLNILSGLYKALRQRQSIPDTGLFKEIRMRVRKYDSEFLPPPPNERMLEYALTSGNLYPLSPEDSLTRDLIIFSLVSGKLDPLSVAAMRKDEMETLRGISLEIAERHISPARKYIFPLGQSQLTANQLRKTVEERISVFLRRRGLPVSSTVERTLSGIWAMRALGLGIAPDVVLACLPAVPDFLPYLQVCQPAFVDESQKTSVIDMVSALFGSEKNHWYAMSMRQGVKFQELQRRLAALSHIEGHTPVKLFYPLEDITRKVGRKIVFEQKPTLGNIVFFQSRADGVAPLFRNIYDIAWCFRDFSKTGRPYAVIRDREMENFRRALGFFTPRHEVMPADDSRLKPGDRVVILNSQFFEKEGRILKRESLPDGEGNIVYRVMLEDAARRWSLSLDIRHLRPL